MKNIRRKNRRFSEMEKHQLDAKMTDTQTPDKIAEDEEWKNVLDYAINAIKPEYAEAFLLKYRDDMTYKAMSKRLDVSVSALKVRVHRARMELKEFIENNFKE